MSGLRVDTLAPRINDTGKDVETQTIVKSGHDIVGFENRTDSYLSFDAIARTVTIAPTGEYYAVYWQGKKHRISETLSIEFANVSGCRYIYLDPIEAILYEGVCKINVRDVLCAYIKYNANTQQLVVEGDERHSADRDLIWHLSQHSDVGMIWRSGGEAEYELNTPNTAIKINGGLVLADEDLIHVVNQGTVDVPYTQDIENGNFEVLHLGGETIVVSEPTGLPYKFNPLTRKIQYNKVQANIGTLVDVPDGHYINAFIVGTNCQRSPIKVLTGRVISDDIEIMLAEGITQFGLAMSELVFMYHVLLKADYSLSNDGLCKISAVYKATTSTGKAVSSPAMGVAQHNALFGRNEQDSHDIDAITGLRAAINSKVDKVLNKGLSEHDFSTEYKEKLDGIQAEATKNSTDAQLRNRGSHTGTQPVSTITGMDAYQLRDPVYTFTKNIRLTTEWENVGILATDMPSGVYAVSIFANDVSVGNNNNSETYTSMVSWYNGTTNVEDNVEFLLTSSGKSAGRFYLRALKTTFGTPVLQCAGSANSTGFSQYIFTFRKLI